MDQESYEPQESTWLTKHAGRAAEIAGAILESEALVVSGDSLTDASQGLVALSEKSGMTALQHQAAFLMGHGCELDEVAAHLGIPEASLHGWIIGHDVFNGALRHYTRVFADDVGRKASQLVRSLLDDPDLETKDLLSALKLALEVRKSQEIKDLQIAKMAQIDRMNEASLEQRERMMNLQERALLARVSGVGVSSADAVEIHGSETVEGVFDMSAQPVTVEPAAPKE
jgi:hypothetical protein